jgi:hydroxymethylpyrimidine pyrophosphatase-like HAD family hydrolase
MERYDQLYELYSGFDTERLRAYQHFVDLFPPVDSPVALEHWQNASEELAEGKDEIREAYPSVGETFADVAARASREQAFTALDLYAKYARAVNVLVLDVDETLRSAGLTDNEIPRETLHALTEFHDAGVPIVVCTGQTLENVKGFLIQGLGNEIVNSGSVSVVYEAGTGVFTPGHGRETKQLLYEDLDADVRSVFDAVRSRVLADAPEDLRRGCHLQGNEFNVTMKPNFETGGDDARRIIDDALVYMLDLLGDAVLEAHAAEVDRADADEGAEDATDEGAEDATDEGGVIAVETEAGIDPVAAAWARQYYASSDSEIRTVLEERGALPGSDAPSPPAAVEDAFQRVTVGYYEADAAEIGSLELNKVVGVETAFQILGIEDPFAVVMGDSKSDRRVMEWVQEHDLGLSAAPEHASGDVLEHVLATDELVFAPGKATDVLETVYALNRLARLES